jgi:hypothetical protein
MPVRPSVALGQAGQAVGLVHFEHVALQHGVVHVALHFDAVVGEHMAVVFDVLAELVVLAVFQPGLEARQHLVARQLRGGVRPGVGQRNVGGLARLHAETDAHDFGAHFVERRGLGVQRHQFGLHQALQPVVEVGPVENGVVHHGAVLRGLGHGAGGMVGKQVAAFAGHGHHGCGRGGRGLGAQRARQALEAVLLVKILEPGRVGRTQMRMASSGAGPRPSRQIAVGLDGQQLPARWAASPAPCAGSRRPRP